MNAATIYCTYRTYYWHAHCTLGDTTFETQARTHGSARQAAEEIFAQVKNTCAGKPVLSRVFPKQYKIAWETATDSMRKEGGQIQ